MSVATEAPLPVDFRPTKLILLSELPAREKEKYFRLLLLNNVKFIRQGDGPEARFIGNFRMLAPFVKKPEEERKKKDSTNYALTFQERLMRLRSEGFVQVQIAGVEPFDYTAYPRFSSLIANTGDVLKPKLRPLSWLMKHVEDIYDARFEHEKNEVEREDDSPSFDLILLIFPIFVVRKVGTNFGLKSLLDQTCWDILYSVHVYRKDYLELEIFARFLQEFYDHDDLLFYLYVRSVISKVLHVNFKTRWLKFDGPGRQPKSQWMSYREALHIARIVFGGDSDDMYKDFILLITPQMIGSKSESTDSRRIDITEYLHLSVVGYHQSQTRATAAAGSATGSTLLPLPGQTVPIMPVPALPSATPQPLSEQLSAEQVRQQELLEEEEAQYFGKNQDNLYTERDDYQEGEVALGAEEREGVYEEMEREEIAGDEQEGEGYLPNEEEHMGENYAEPLQAGQELQGAEQTTSMNPFEQLQLDREEEFMAQLLQPLQDSPLEVYQYVDMDLKERLHQTVSMLLSDREINDLDGLDASLVEILSLEQLIQDMEAIRDEIVLSLMPSPEATM